MYSASKRKFIRPKLYKLTKRIRKRIRHFEIKKINYYKFFLNRHIKTFKILSNFSITQRLFISEKKTRQVLMNILYKSIKTDLLTSSTTNTILNKFEENVENKIFHNQEKNVYFFNLYKRFLWKMRRARYAHWNYKTKGTLNKYRYDKLLRKDLTFVSTNHTASYLLFIIFNSYGLLVSWKQLLLLMWKQIIVINGEFVHKDKQLKTGDIIELPFGKNLISKKKKLI